jgi:ribosomal protein S6
MTDSNMPAAEAVVETGAELQSYELAFHVLPTVAEGEVSAVFDRIKASISAAGGKVTNEESPARFDLAYEIDKFLEGRNRKFKSAYFGWVRFDIEAAKLEVVTAEVEHMKEILRHLVTRLTKVEAENPFFFHPAIADRVVETIIVEGEEEVVEAAQDTEEVAAAEAEDGEATEETV